VGQPSWDARYQGDDFVYGTAPNDFLRDQITRLPVGKVLCRLKGGSQCGVLAERGFTVTAVDMSPVGLEKARRLAEQRGVAIDTVVADLADFRLEPGAWDGIVDLRPYAARSQAAPPPRGRRRLAARWRLRARGLPT
jgi:hypothetical protein